MCLADTVDAVDVVAELRDGLRADSASLAAQRTFEVIHDELIRLTGECPARGDCVICAERKDDRTQPLCMVTETV